MHQFRKERLLFYVFLFTTGCNDMGSGEDNAENEISTYSMPSIILGSNISISIYNNSPFDNIITIPDDLEWYSDTSITSYEKEYEVLNYNMNIHKI